MRRDVVRRVRWGNVALACAVLAALGAVVAWPLVSAPPPRLPPDTPRPLVAGEPAPTGGARSGGAASGARRRAGATAAWPA